MNTYVRQLLVLFHGGLLWIDEVHFLYVELIASIIVLLMAVMDPALYLKKISGNGDDSKG